MRKSFQWWLVVTFAISSLAQVGVTASPEQHEVSKESQIASDLIVALPNFDIRQEPKTVSLASAVDSEQSRSAVEAFRERLSPSLRDKLTVQFNEAGVPTSFFNHGGALSKARAGAPDDIAREFLAQNRDIFRLSRREVRGLKLENEDNDNGTTFLNYEQTINGITVFHGHVQVVVNSNGEVISVWEGVVIPGARLNTTPALSESEGLAMAVRYAGRDNSGGLRVLESRAERGDQAVFENPISANGENLISDLRIISVGAESRLAWHSYIDVGPNEWYEICVDAFTGELLFRFNLYADVAQGTVFVESPDHGAQTLQSFVGDTVINTAAGWLGAGTATTGNNVEAYLDTDANNTPDAINGTGLVTGHASATDQNFSFPFVTGVDPRTQRAAVVSNLFFYVNRIHDFSYNLGFTESAGNFQVNNFNRGGLGNDSVRAEAQDGSGTNNANFGTPPDGSRPRMQQFLFTGGTTAFNDDRDSSLDADIVFHEFGHGISNRLVGGPANTSCLGGVQAGAMGEAWSDYWACTLNGDGAVGEYATNRARGVRRAAYTVPADPVHDSYADLGVGGFQVHRDGEVWAATLFDLRNEIGATISDRIILQGMKFTPCSPSFLNARDGILQADQNLNGGANRCAIWTVFARHGMGVSATGNNGTTHNAATDLPADCAGGGGGENVLFEDTFENSSGWTAGADTATTGRWEIGNPEETNSSGIKQLGAAVSGNNDLVTGRLAGASAGANDIDGGTTIIRSRAITLPASSTPQLSFSFYLAHGANSSTADFLRVRIVSGTTITTVFQRLGAAANVNGAWQSTTVNLSSFAGQTVNIQIEAADASGASLVEAGVDDIRVTRQ